MNGGVIPRKMVLLIGAGVIKASCPSKLKGIGDHIVMTEGCARGVLRSMESCKRKRHNW